MWIALGRPKLTGKSRYRAEKDGRLILQVQETAQHTPTTWRDARVEDLTVTDTIPEVAA